LGQVFHRVFALQRHVYARECRVVAHQYYARDDHIWNTYCIYIWFCGGINLPPPVTKKAYNEHLIKIEKLALSHAEEVMKDASEWLKKNISAEQPDNIESGEIDIAHVAVTVDGKKEDTLPK
jgi:hypothetical protein